jgi:hypothetical protein
MNEIYYDDALACFVSIVNDVFGKDVLERNVFLRDAQGKLTLFTKMKYCNSIK